MKNIGKLLLVLSAMIISPIINGIVFCVLWSWFVVPIFRVRPLRTVEAIGIMILIGFILIRKTKEVDEDNFWETFLSDIVFVIITAGYFLLTGWVVMLFL